VSGAALNIRKKVIRAAGMIPALMRLAERDDRQINK
jgi:hypothetical protein